jgi:polyisoprenoid-binding protein YceI
MNYCRRACALQLALATILMAAPASAKILKLKVDPMATQIVATVDEPLPRIRGNVSGSLQVITGEITGDPDDPVRTGHIDIVVNATTYTSDSPHRDNKVLHDVLETRFFPIIKFVSTRIEDLKWDKEGVMGSATIVGNLMLHGVTREVQVPISAMYASDDSFSADGDFQIDCTDYGIKRPSLFGALKAGKIVDINFRIIAEPVDAPAATPAQQ